MKPSALSRIATRFADPHNVSKAVEAQKSRRREQAAYEAPVTPTEETLSALWSKVLAIDKVGRNDNFFHMGGHSLLATQMLARVRDAFHVELQLRVLFEAPVLASFAQKVDSSRNSAVTIDRPTPFPRGDTSPVSFAQQRLWFLDQLTPGNPFYNIPQRYRLFGKLNLAAFQEAIDRTVRRHESLRTTFAGSESGPVQIIAAGQRIPVRYLDLAKLENGSRESETLRLVQEEAVTPFNLADGPMMRVLMIRLGEEEHDMVINIHHIVYDRWSHSVLIDEITGHYRDAWAGAPDTMRPLAVQYADYAVWHRRYMEGEVIRNQVAYWKDRLAGAPAVVEFPADRPRTGTDLHRGAMEERVIPAELLSRLRSLCQQESATLFMGLLAAFKLLLSRYSGLEDIVVGSPIANRNLTEIEPLIGFFVSTLVLRTDLSGNPTFRELVQRVRETCLGAYANESVPFERLVEELQPERSLSHNPIFQVMFALQPAPIRTIDLPELRMERRRLHTGTAVFDATWFAFFHGEDVLLRVEYNTDLFDQATICRTLDLYLHLLETATAQPEKGTADLALLNAAERRRVVTEFNDTATAYESGVRVHDFLARQAAIASDATALVYGTERITFGELNARANRIAHALIRRGVGPDVLVGVYMKRTPDMVAAILGILKSGGAYVPLDPNYPQDRVGYILEAANAPVVLTQRSLAECLPVREGAEIICVDRSAGGFEDQPATNPEVAVLPENLAYVLFTSGSTGRPKGVALTHANGVNFVHWCLDAFSAQELSGVLFCTSICFDMSTFEMFVTIAAGGKMILVENPLYLPAAEAHDEVTLINTVPSAIAELVRIKGVPASLKTVALAGEALPQSLVDEIAASTGVDKIWNLYGPTESGYATGTLARPGQAVTIGKPIANIQGYVLDARLNPVPVGVSGELYLAGAGLARGYYGREDLTRERFVENPFAPGERMYKTGDLCRWRADGDIEYLGRIDHQVKIRGFRVELGEVESALNSHPSVRQSLAMAREDVPGQKQLVAYLVSSTAEPVSVDALRAHMKQSLPDFMVPAAFVCLPAFPLNPNGKIDRKQLPAPDRQQAQARGRVPETEIEQILAGIWSEILKLSGVGAEQDFFELGGHSLLATQVVSRVRQSLNVVLPLQAIFEDSTVELLARRVEALMRSGVAERLPKLKPVQRTSAMPLSFAQHRLWFFDQFAPDSVTFNLPATMRAEGPLKLDALQGAFESVIARHESLRTVFHSLDGEPQQVILPSVDFHLDIIDISDTPENQRETEWNRLTDEEINRPFDLSNGPLLRVTVIRLADEDHIVIMVMHHIIGDRWSTGVLSRELTAFYNARVHGTAAQVTELAVQYVDYSVWQRECLRGEALESQLSYWKQELQGAPQVITLPTDRPRRVISNPRGATVSRLIPAETVHALEAVAGRERATLFMVLLAGFQALLARYSGQDDVIVGAPMANRNRTETENLIGFFINTLPLRARLAGDPTFSEFLARVKQTSLAAYANQELPFDKLVEELHPERSLSHDPVVQVFFVLQNAPVEDTPELAGVSLTRQFKPTRTAKGDMYLSIGWNPGGLMARLEYNAELFDACTIEQMLTHYQNLLQGVVENISTPVSGIPILSAAESERALVTWNDTASDYPWEKCLHELFEEKAELAPAAVACLFDSDEITYGELNRRANQLAHYLKSRNLGPGARVGICVERSLEMMVGLFGIQKSGAAYVPIDPEYPSERIRLILEEAQVPVLITQQALVDGLPPCAGEILCLDRDWAAIGSRPETNPASSAGPEDLLYVIFTSGSTGRPKGVQVPHRAVVNLMTAMADLLCMGPRDTFPALASFAFDMCIPELYLALVTGGRVAIGRRNLAADGEELAAFLCRHGATIIHATPTTWNLLLEAGYTGRGLKRAIGAEALPQDLCRRLLEADSSLYNFYGPTETTVWSTAHHFRDKDERVVLGRPLANQQVYVLDARRQPVPIGVAGEIYIGGEGVTRGYLNRPDLTEEKFVSDPFQRGRGGKLYRTGDIGRYLTDGRVEFWGRADHQVKIRGYRIELGEIETVLGRHPAIRECVVIVREDVPGDKRLVGYVVPAANQNASTEELRDWVRQHMPDYMVPVAVVSLERFPLTPNGKVDRKNLPVPEYRRLDSGGEYSMPRTATEEIIATIWAEVLQLDRVGINDQFFELGGHSMLATQVVSRIRRTLQVELPVRALFESPTVAGLSESVDRMKRGEIGLLPPPITAVSRDRALPLSFAQQRLWILDQLEPDSPLYNIPQTLRMTGEVNVQALQQAVADLVARHEVLRTVYRTEKEQPVQLVLHDLEIPLQVVDFSHLPAGEREAGARRFAQYQADRPFNLSQDAMLRPFLLRLDERDHVLLLFTHHIASDGWSMGVALRDLIAFYEAALENQSAVLPDLPVQYADYSVWQRQWLQGEALQKHLEYWKIHLQDAPPVLALPTDRPRPEVQTVRGASADMLLPPDVRDAIHALSRKEKATPFMTMLAAFQILILYYTNQPDLVLGTDVAGRNSLQTENLIGFFVNLLVLRTDLSGDPGFGELVGRVREVVLGAYTHQDAPFDKLVEELRPERSLSHNPLVQVLFVQQNRPRGKYAMPGVEFSGFKLDYVSRFDLAVFAREMEQGLVFFWLYNPDLFDTATVERMAHLYKVVLEQVVADPTINLNAILQVLAQAEDRQRAAEHQEFQRASLQKLKSIKRRSTIGV